uniref:C-type lectin domain-containing protein n=1 Tax=Eptatretus burgeri TaxID=7764 RepID=A0A8C4Q1A2_EPTBU
MKTLKAETRCLHLNIVSETLHFLYPPYPVAPNCHWTLCPFLLTKWRSCCQTSTQILQPVQTASKKNPTTIIYSKYIIINRLSCDFFRYIQRVEDTSHWIGLDDRDNEGQFKWHDGTLLQHGWKFFYEGEPRGETRDEDCVHITMAKYGHRWNDLDCSSKLPFICQY